MVKNAPFNAGDTGDGERSPAGGNGNSLQYSCLENSLGGLQCMESLRAGHNLTTEHTEH